MVVVDVVLVVVVVDVGVLVVVVVDVGVLVVVVVDVGVLVVVVVDVGVLVVDVVVVVLVVDVVDVGVLVVGPPTHAAVSRTVFEGVWTTETSSSVREPMLSFCHVIPGANVPVADPPLAQVPLENATRCVSSAPRSTTTRSSLASGSPPQ
ncbi:hypothetical protein [Halarchaeum rubridurum]|uniref:hypothetical protein n=1 Tax=Halarchaeum rubridurum TaxID=489911 RepID=UPI001662F68D|nr:hypothetical protein [Halarchaeum rubridurum]